MAPNIKTNEADVVIAIGMRFDDRVTGKVAAYARQAKIVHLEVDPAEINKIIHADAPVLGNAKKSLRMLIDNVNPNSHQEWLNEFRACDKIEYEKVIAHDIYPKKVGLTMGEVVRIASEENQPRCDFGYRCWAAANDRITLFQVYPIQEQCYFRWFGDYGIWFASRDGR